MQTNVIADRENLEFITESSATNSSLVPIKLINYVKNTQELVLVNNLELDLPIVDEYLLQANLQSLLALPLKHQQKIIGVLYLHSPNISNIFNPERMIVLEFICSQAAIAINNAQLYQTLEQQVEERTQALHHSQNTLQNLLAGTASVTGEEFLPALVKQIAKALRCSYVFISQQKDEMLETVAWYAENQLQKPFSYPLAHTPCETAIQQGYFSCSTGVRQIYPLDADLEKMGADSYLGVALRDRMDNVIGVLCVLDYQPIQNLEFARMLLQLFGERAAVELERQSAEQALAQLNHELEARLVDRTARLADSEKRFKTLFDDAADAVFLLGEEGFIDCNQAALNLLSYSSKDELLSLHPHQISPERQPDGRLSADKEKGLIQEALQRCSLRFEWLMHRRNGENFWAEVTLTPIKYPQEIILHYSVRDISDRKAAEKALIKSKNKFRTLLSNLDGMVYRCQHDRDWTMEFMSDAILRLSGYPATDFIKSRKRPYTSIIHPDDLERVEQALAQGLEKHQVFTMEYRIIHKDGSLRWVTEKGKGIFNQNNELQYLEGVVFDISDRKLVEEELRASKQRYATLTAAAPVGIFRTNADGDCIYVNERWCSIAGIAPKVALGKGWQTGLHPEDRERIFAEWYQSVQENRPFSLEYRFQRFDGNVSWVYGQSIAEKDRDGQIIGYVGTVTDITDRKQAESALITQQNHLEALRNNIPHLAWIKDAENRFIAVNQPFAESCNCSITDIVGKTDYDIWSPKLAQAYIKDDLEVLSSGKRKIVEEKIIKNDNIHGWIETTKTPFKNAQGGWAGTVGIAVDVTDYKDNQEKLYQSQQLLQLVLDTIPQSVFWKDKNFNYLGCNQAFAHNAGLPSPEDIVGKSDYEMPWKQDESEFYIECDHRIMSTGQAELGIIETQLTAEGKNIYIETNKSPLLDPDGNVIGILGTIQDVTLKKEAEKTLKQVNEELETRVFERTSALERANAEAELVNKYEKTLNRIIKDIRQSLDLKENFSVVTKEVRNLFSCERVAIYQFDSSLNGKFLYESKADDFPLFVDGNRQAFWNDSFLKKQNGDLCNLKQVYCVDDIYMRKFSFCHLKTLKKFQIRAYLIVPIFVGDKIWGLLAAYNHSRPRQWQSRENQTITTN